MGIPFGPGAAPFLFLLNEVIISSLVSEPHLKGQFGASGRALFGGYWFVISLLLSEYVSLKKSWAFRALKFGSRFCLLSQSFFANL